MPPWAEENEAHCRQAKPGVTSNEASGLLFVARSAGQGSGSSWREFSGQVGGHITLCNVTEPSHGLDDAVAGELAGASQCLLVDRDALAGWIQSFQAAQTQGPRFTPRPTIPPGRGD